MESVAPVTRYHDQDIKMHCFICVTYMIILTSANPITTREIATKHEKRSLFRDVIESLRIRSQLPEGINHKDDNNLAHSYDSYGYENEPLQLPTDAEFIPRRNDRIEMPPLKYRFPKSLDLNDTDEKSNVLPKEEVVVYIDTHETPAPKPTTQKPKKRPQANKNKPDKNRESEAEDSEPTDEKWPLNNSMAGQSQIGNRESQTVIKPTVIVNIRGTVSHTDSDIKLERRGNNETLDIPRNVFNINQEINLDKNEPGKKANKIKQDLKVIATRENAKNEEDMMMCETAGYNSKSSEEHNRKFDNVLQILFSI